MAISLASGPTGRHVSQYPINGLLLLLGCGERNRKRHRQREHDEARDPATTQNPEEVPEIKIGFVPSLTVLAHQSFRSVLVGGASLEKGAPPGPLGSGHATVQPSFITCSSLSSQVG